MKRIGFTLGLLLSALIGRSSMGQDFWYVPPGSSIGYQSGISLGHGAGFGYGVGFGFDGKPGSSGLAVPQAQSDISLPETGEDVEEAISHPMVNKDERIKAYRDRQLSLQQSRKKAKDAARSRNLRFFEFQERHAAISKSLDVSSK